ncbi:MAG: MATE family efflux transporter [Rhodospirillales bacterium]|nr:MATE family efflux transporter [Rhodospirillales bacterium]
MTRRSPLLREWAWHRRVWRLAWPMVVSNLSVPLLGAVDTAVIGHLPEPHFLGAVAVGALIFNTVYFGCNFLRMGTTGLTAQAFGARDFDAARATLARALLIALVLAVALLALQGPIGWLAFYLVEPSEAVAGEGMRYYFIRIWAAPAALANIALVGWFIGMQNTRAALVLLLTVNGINIVLDLVLVLGFGLAVAGAAWATVAADYAGMILGAAVTARLARRHRGRWRAGALLDVAAMRRFLGINRDIFLRTLLVVTAFALFTTLSARQGDVVLAANAVLLNFVIFFNFAFDGFAFAAEALTGRALGARRREDLSRAIRACLAWCLLLSLLSVAVYGLAGAPIVRVLTDLEDVRAVAYDFLPWLIAMPLVAVWGIFFDGVFTGTTRTAHMRNNMLLAFVVFVPCAWLLREPMGNHGLWLAMTLLYAVRGIGLGAVYARIQRRGGFLPADTPRVS